MRRLIYLKTKWKHDNPDDPLWIYQELGDDRFEIRKVEIFADGTSDRASSSEETSRTHRAGVANPPIAEIALDPQFEPYEISADEFEGVWHAAAPPQ